jgi:hypothetical protein
MPHEEDDSAAHIICHQNKDLCTACDVAVWIVVTNNLEIKWCNKGCKNRVRVAFSKPAAYFKMIFFWALPEAIKAKLHTVGCRIVVSIQIHP